MAIVGYNISDLDPVSDPATELAGADFEVDVLLGPVATGRKNKRVKTEQLQALFAGTVTGASGAPQWVAGPQTLGALVYNAGYVYRVKQNIANGQTAPTATNQFYLRIGDSVASPGTSSAQPFGPLAAATTYPLPAAAGSLRAVTVLSGTAVTSVFSTQYTLAADGLSFTMKPGFELDPGEQIEGLLFAGSPTTTPGPGTITPGGTIGTPGILVLNTTGY